MTAAPCPPSCLTRALDEIADAVALLGVLSRLFEGGDDLGEFLVISATLERLAAAKAELAKIQEGAE